MQLDIIYSLWSLKPCIEFLLLLHKAFRNPASGHRLSRSQLKTAVQNLIGVYCRGSLRWMTFSLNCLMYVLPKHDAEFWQVYPLLAHEIEYTLNSKYIFFV